MTAKKTSSQKKIVDMFISMYEDVHGEHYRVNWPMIKTAERVAAYYSVSDIAKAMEYFFRTRTNHTLWDFVEGIDTFLARAQKEEEARSRIDKLLKETEKRMEELG